MHRPKAHYLPLDSIRGIAALSVVVHHFVISPVMIARFQGKAWIDFPFFHNAWLFVDLFFVLSGMVISLNYAKSDFGHFSFRDFIARRLARIYPLHIVTLLLTLALRLLKLALVAGGVLAAVSSENEVNTFYSFALNVLLLHSLGFLNHLSWNGPSWSISVEFYTYILFGILLLATQTLRSRRVFYLASLLLVVACWLLIVFGLHEKSLDFHYDYGIFRCIVGFFVGVLVVRVALRHSPTDSPVVGAGLQIGSFLACAVMVCIVGQYPSLSFAAPLLFAALLGSLMRYPTAWPLPGLLKISPLVWLGKRSYSIYMIHAVILSLAEYAVRLLGQGRLAALDLAVPGLVATLTLAAIVAAVLIASNWTYRYVEVAGGKLFSRLLIEREPLPAHLTQTEISN